MAGLRSIKPLAKDSLRGVVAADIGKRLPKFEFVDPCSLYVEDSYQRAIAENGIALIRKIYSGFAWNRFKPPICVRLPESGNVLVCIDGQHTATACATHPGIDKIPVMIVDAADAAKRANAFVGHNKDRLALTTIMIYAAELAAGDPLAVMIDEACREAGAIIPRRAISTSKDKHPVGTTISIGAIRAIAKQQGEAALVRVLKLLVAAGRGPIKSVEVTAAAVLFAHHPKVDDGKLRAIIAGKTVEIWTAEAHAESVVKGKAMAICLACAWCRLLGLAEPDIQLKGNATDHARVIAKTDASPVISRRPVAAPAAAPIAPPPLPAPAQAAPLPKQDCIVRDGVSLDLQDGMLSRKGSRVKLTEQEAGAVAILLKVMPAMLPFARIAEKAFGESDDAAYRVKNLATVLQPKLLAAGLKLREVPKMGLALGAV